MPRLRRSDNDGEYHHIIIKGHNAGPIVSSEAEADELIGRIGSAFRDEGVGTIAYCFLSNHGHMFGTGRIGPISGAMARALGPYARSRNRRMGRSGSMFVGRFWSRPVTSSSHALHLPTYVLANARKAGLASSVEGLASYRWCSYAATFTGAPSPIPLDLESLFALYGGSMKTARRELLGRLLETEAQWNRDRRMESLGAVIRVVAAKHGLPEELVRSGRRGSWWNAARRDVVVEARRLLGTPVPTLAAALSVSPDTIWRTLRENGLGTAA